MLEICLSEERKGHVSHCNAVSSDHVSDSGRAGVKAVEVAGQILDLLARNQHPIALRDLAAAGHMSPGKAHRYLASFVASGLARQDSATRRYALGPLSMRLGLAALNSYQPLRDAIALVRDLRNRLDETLVLSVWSAQGPTVVHVEDSSQPIIMTMRVGAVLPMLASATGLVFATFLPRHFVEPLMTASLNSGDGYKVFTRDPTKIEQLITQVRDQGYAYNEGHLMPGVSALAFPLTDRAGTLVAVMAVMGREERLKPPGNVKIISSLHDAARSFSR
jgi:DNA-binding IclR family transcriptional regulator